MNTAILHAARPEKSKSGTSKLPKAALKFAQQMGIDLSGLEAEAEDIWSTLNDLSTNKPEEYDSFIQEQFANAKLEEDLKADPNYKDNSPKYFRPHAGICVRVRTTGGDGIKVRLNSSDEGSGKKFFINLCSHEALQPPVDAEGNPALNDRFSADGLQFPLLVGPLRDVMDSKQQPSLAADIIFHPIVIDRCKQHVSFKKQVVELAMHWIHSELKVTFEASSWQSLKAPYFGGRGDSKSVPVLFSVDHAMAQSEAQERKDRASITAGAADKNPLSLTDEALGLSSSRTYKSTSSSSSSTNAVISSPSALLEYMRNDQTNHSPSHPPTSSSTPLPPMLTSHSSNTQKRHNKPLGVDIDSSSPLSPPRVEILDAVENPPPPPNASAGGTAAQKAKKPTVPSKPLIKKGFLEAGAKKGQLLYPEGGSSEGAGTGKGGTYARFMDKCKVVDMTSMTPEQVSAMTKQHAVGTSATSEPIGKASKPSTEKKELTATEKAELDQLMSMVDEEFSQLKLKSKGDEVWTDQLGDLRKLLGSTAFPIPTSKPEQSNPLPSDLQVTSQLASSLPSIGGGSDTDGTVGIITENVQPTVPNVDVVSQLEGYSSLSLNTVCSLENTNSANEDSTASGHQSPVKVSENVKLEAGYPVGPSSPLRQGCQLDTCGLPPTVTVSVETAVSMDTLKLVVSNAKELDLKRADLQVAPRELKLTIPILQEARTRTSTSTATTASVTVKTKFNIHLSRTSASLSKKRAQLTVTFAREEG